MFGRIFKDKFLILIFIIAILIRLPLYHTEFWRSPDALEYLNVAQNIAEGHGLTKNIKWHYFDSFPITTSAFTGRPLVTSIVFAAVLKISSDPYFVQMFLLILGAFNCMLSYFLFKKFFSPKISFLGSLFFAINPNSLIVNRMLISEPVFTTIVLCGFIVFLNMKDSVKKVFILGIISSIAFLTRIEGIALLIVFLFWYIKKLKMIISIGLGFLIFFLINCYGEFRAINLFFYSYNSFHLRVFQFSEGMWEGFGRTFPSTETFIVNNSHRIIGMITNSILENISNLFKLGSVGILSLLYFFVDKKTWKKFWPFLIFSLLVVLIPSVVWSMFSEPERHYSTIFPFLIMPILALFKNEKFRKVFILLTILTLAIYSFFDFHRLAWSNAEEIQTDSWNYIHRSKVFEWIKKNTQPQSIIASPNPWLVEFYTRRPSALLPTNLEKNKLLEKYISQYKIDYFVVEDKNYVSFFEKYFGLKFTAESVWIFSTKDRLSYLK